MEAFFVVVMAGLLLGVGAAASWASRRLASITEVSTKEYDD